MPSPSWFLALGALSCIGALGCGGAPTPCADRTDEAQRGYCLLHEVQSASTPAEAVAICAGAGTWTDACREVWLLRAMRPGTSYTAADLLPIARADDARMMVLDGLPAADVATQLAACAQHTGQYVCDCTWHAMERWAQARPAEAELARVATLAGPCNQQRSTGLGLAIGCTGAGSCDLARDRQACVTAAAGARAEPSACDPTAGRRGY